MRRGGGEREREGEGEGRGERERAWERGYYTYPAYVLVRRGSRSSRSSRSVLLYLLAHVMLQVLGV